MSDNRDYIFHLDWQDIQKNSFRVGFLAQIEKEFYFILSERKIAESAYNRGFVGIPGFRAGEIYRSAELFDFFERRISNKNSENPCEELAKNKGVSMVDSFTLEEVPKKMLPKYRETILKAYEVQCKKQEMQKNRENFENKTKPKNDSER